jgi:membrane associated rhomboid family serine protease
MEIYIYLIKIGAILIATMVGYWFVKLTMTSREKIEEDLDYSPVDPKLLESHVRKYGRNTSSVVHFYGTLSYFEPFKKGTDQSNQALVAYISNSQHNIMIMDPLCDRRNSKDAIAEFTKFTQLRQKTSLLFPIDHLTARQAAELGYGVIQVGKEPVFELQHYSSDVLDKKILSSIKQVFKKGISIEAFSYKEIKANGFEEGLNEILDEWLLSRRSEKMKLLLEVSPFKFSEEKIYFVARSKDKIEGFLACSPIFGRNGFFIHDLIRRPSSMNGVAEALTVAALTKLKADGFEFASLGTAPLAGLDTPGVNSNYKMLNKLLVHIFNSHKTFMRFKSLYNFKKKFKPTSEEPTYFAFFPPTLKVQDALAIAGLFSSQGPIGDLIFKMRRWLAGEQLPQPLIKILSPDIATLARPIPFSFVELLTRLRFTFAVFVLNIYTYLNTTGMLGELSPDTIRRYGFSYRDFANHKWLTLLTSNFLHFNYAHLCINLFMLLLFCGTLEFLGGSLLAALSFLIGMDANVPTGMILLPYLKSINFGLWQHVFTYMDVGASLGIMGSLGALMQFIKYKRLILMLVCLLTVALAVIQNELFGIDHTFAVLIGYAVAHVYLQKRSQKRGFRRFFALPDHPIL